MEPALFLKRNGGVCGPRYVLDPSSGNMVGRSFPPEETFGAQAPKLPAPPDWDLAGIHELERRHVAFRHISVRQYDEHAWEGVALSERHRVFVNRTRIQEPRPLHSGDEIGLDSLLLEFHDPTPRPQTPRKNLAQLGDEAERERIASSSKPPVGMVSGEGLTRDDDKER